MGINFVSVPPTTNLPQLSTADGLYGLPSVINWPFAGDTWHTERWVEYHLTREAAYDTNRREFRVYGRLDVRDT